MNPVLTLTGPLRMKTPVLERRFLKAGGRIEWQQCNDHIASATFTHPQGGTVKITCTRSQAMRSSWSPTAGMWKRYPRQMLRSYVIRAGIKAISPMQEVTQ